MLQVWQDVQAGSRPSTWCPISLPLFLSLSVLSKSNHLLFSFPFSLSFTTSYSVPSPNPYHEPKISYDICRPAERKTASKEKTDIFFTLRSLSWWLWQSATESFWQKHLRILKRAYGNEASGTRLGRQLQSKGNSVPRDSTVWSRVYVLFWDCDCSYCQNTNLQKTKQKKKE